jgi:hypothetical protein
LRQFKPSDYPGAQPVKPAIAGRGVIAPRLRPSGTRSGDWDEELPQKLLRPAFVELARTAGVWHNGIAIQRFEAIMQNAGRAQ